jgi:hypothetical protein
MARGERLGLGRGPLLCPGLRRESSESGARPHVRAGEPSRITAAAAVPQPGPVTRRTEITSESRWLDNSDTLSFLMAT